MSDKVPCKICGTPTEMTGTKLCDRCWEVDHNLDWFARWPNGRKAMRDALAAAEEVTGVAK